MADRAMFIEPISLQPVIALAGPSAAGKSTWATHLASVFQASQLRFGDYVAHKARQRGIQHPDRRTLQTLGTQLLENNGPELFCRDALNYAAWQPDRPLVIDGVRHEGVHRSLIHIIGGEKLLLVYVDRPDSERLHELANEGIRTDAELRQFDNDPTEREVRSRLRARADVQIEGRLPDDDTTAEVLQHLVAAEKVKKAIFPVNVHENPILTSDRIFCIEIPAVDEALAWLARARELFRDDARPWIVVVGAPSRSDLERLVATDAISVVLPPPDGFADADEDERRALLAAALRPYYERATVATPVQAPYFVAAHAEAPFWLSDDEFARIRAATEQPQHED